MVMRVRSQKRRWCHRFLGAERRVTMFRHFVQSMARTANNQPGNGKTARTGRAGRHRFRWSIDHRICPFCPGFRLDQQRSTGDPLHRMHKLCGDANQPCCEVFGPHCAPTSAMDGSPHFTRISKVYSVARLRRCAPLLEGYQPEQCQRLQQTKKGAQQGALQKLNSISWIGL